MSPTQVNRNTKHRYTRAAMIKAIASYFAWLVRFVSGLFDDIQSYMAIRSITMSDLDMQYNSV